MTLLDADIKQDPVLGEDTWELFELIEDSFGVDFGDYYALYGITVRELAEVIDKKANYPTEEKCLSSVVFYKLRRTLGELFGIPRTAIRPSTSVSELLPWRYRSARWKMLQEHLGLTFPSLYFPVWFLLLSLIGPPALFVTLLKFWRPQLGTIWMINGSLLLIFLTFMYIVPAIDKRFHLSRILPKGCETFGGLVKIVLARNFDIFASQNGSSGAAGILMSLSQLIAAQVSFDIEKISSETRIPQDLNIY